MEKQLREMDIEMEELEKKYYKKIAELLIVMQAHCEVKTDIINGFDKLGL